MDNFVAIDQIYKPNNMIRLNCFFQWNDLNFDDYDILFFSHGE